MYSSSPPKNNYVYHLKYLYIKIVLHSLHAGFCLTCRSPTSNHFSRLVDNCQLGLTNVSNFMNFIVISIHCEVSQPAVSMSADGLRHLLHCLK
jgi:hypothetical protein